MNEKNVFETWLYRWIFVGANENVDIFVVGLAHIYLAKKKDESLNNHMIWTWNHWNMIIRISTFVLERQMPKFDIFHFKFVNLSAKF